MVHGLNTGHHLKISFMYFYIVILLVGYTKQENISETASVALKSKIAELQYLLSAALLITEVLCMVKPSKIKSYKSEIWWSRRGVTSCKY